MSEISTFKIITITESECKKFLSEMIDYEADKLGDKAINFAGTIIEDALKNKTDYNKPLGKPLQGKSEKKITIKVKSDTKKKFTDWAKEKNRSQARHAAYLLEKWCEFNKVTPESCELQ